MDDKSTASHLASAKPVCAEISEEVQQFNSWKVTNTKTVVLLNSRETDMTQVTSLNTWIAGKYFRSTLSLCILMILALLHINQGMLTCSKVRTRYSLNNDWSQGFRLRDQEELPCCDACVKLPCQGHIKYSLLLGRDVLKYELCVYPPALLAPCCNPTNHLKPMPSRWVSCANVTLEPE